MRLGTGGAGERRYRDAYSHMKSFFRPMDGPTTICVVLLMLAAAASVTAQEPVAESADEAEHGAAPLSETGSLEEPVDAEPSPACVAPEPRYATLAKLTPVFLSIDAPLGSKLSASGEAFPITVTEPVMFEGEEVIPVGTQGMGEVVHAKKAGGSGSGGELILTASFVELNDQRIPLRSMKLGLTGKDQTDLALATGIFAGPVGFLVRGKNVNVPAGTFAGAKLAQETQILLGGSNLVEPGDCMEGT